MKIAVGIKKCETCNTKYDFFSLIQDYVEEIRNKSSPIALTRDYILVPIFRNEEYFVTTLSGDETSIFKFPLWVIENFNVPSIVYNPEHIYLDRDKDILTMTVYYPSGIQLRVAVCILEYESRTDEKGKRSDLVSKHPTRSCLQRLVDDMIIIPEASAKRN